MYGPIGLCCISLKQRSLLITEAQICGLFSDLAQISKVLIFEREPSLKCFVEFGDTKSFERALRNVECIPQEFGKVSLYHSKKESLKNAVEFHGTQNPIQPSNSTPKNGEISDSPPFNSGHPSRRDSHHGLDVDCSHQRSCLAPGNHQPLMPNPNNPLYSETPSLQPITENDLFPCELACMVLASTGSNQTQPPQCPVVLVEGFLLPPKHIRLLQNIIGCFGNLLRMVANFEAHRFFAEMENAHQANLVSIYLENFAFFDSPLTIRLSSTRSLHPPSAKFEGLNFYQLEEKTHRFKKHLPIKFNPPSKTLHFTSLSPEVNHLVLYDLVQQVHEPIFIYKLFKTSGQSSMYLIELDSLRDSMEVLAALHNKTVGSKSMKISFSHPEIT